jgi:hypothetical protein
MAIAAVSDSSLRLNLLLTFCCVSPFKMFKEMVGRIAGIEVNYLMLSRYFNYKPLSSMYGE